MQSVTVQIALRAAMREQIGPSARAAGFKGSAPNWRKEGQPGDWAIANIQLSQWGDRESTSCYINLAVAPAPWLEFQCRSSAIPKAVSESYGLYRRRLGTRWEVPSEASAASVVADMKASLEDDGWPCLTALLDREAFMHHLRVDGLGDVKRAYGYTAFLAKVEAVLLSDDGPSPALEEQLAIMLESVDPDLRVRWETDAAWIQERAERHGRSI